MSRPPPTPIRRSSPGCGARRPPRVGADSGLVRWRLAQPLDDGREPDSRVTGWPADRACWPTCSAGRAGPAAEASSVRLLLPTPVLFERELDEIAGFLTALGRRRPGAVTRAHCAPAGAGKATLAAQGHGRSATMIAVDARALASRIPLPPPCASFDTPRSTETRWSGATPMPCPNRRAGRVRSRSSRLPAAQAPRAVALGAAAPERRLSRSTEPAD